MADLIIRGMEMPPKGKSICIEIFGGGGVHRFGECYPCALAYEVKTPHGRLIDADAFKADCLAATKEAKPDFIRQEDWLKSCAVTMSFCRDIDERPTIVPAEGGWEDGV